MVDYKFYNANPAGLLENDCVCRAISDALDLDYNYVLHKLYLIGELFECESLNICCYHHLLEQVFGLIPNDAQGKTVQEIVEEFPNDILLIRLNGHLTMAECGTVYDLWDCRDEIADIFWIIPYNY